MIARVATEVSADRLFDYAVPEDLAPRLRAGQRVRVPFGRKFVDAYVIELRDATGPGPEGQGLFPELAARPPALKAILALDDDVPYLSAPLINLARWMADYTCAPFELTLRCMLPAAVRNSAMKAKEQLYVSPCEGAFELTPRQTELLANLRRVDGGWLHSLTREFACTPQTLKALAAKGAAVIERRQMRRDPLANRKVLPTRPLTLMPEQAAALSVILAALEPGARAGGADGPSAIQPDKIADEAVRAPSHAPSRAPGAAPKPVLLFGVTGSGKTEVYLQAIARALEQGRGAIVLVPEIALTPQTVQRFAARFGRRIAVLHSALSDGERFDEWHRIRTGEAVVVVGPRSAVFAPVKDLGLIVVDEEHEPSYKQDETPRYNARDVAVMRGHLENCAVVLGSATPAMETWLNVQKGKYTLTRLTRRVAGRPMPRVYLVDMRLETARTGHAQIFSGALLEALKLRLERGEQSILFLNRRGYANSLVCPKCGYAATCPDCSVAYTYHQADACLRCHVCGGWRPVPEACPDCGDPAFKYAGFGTQRVELALQKCFPLAHVLRMDADVTARKHSHDELLAVFKSGRADILIGTQMIAKGLDFPNVTLVGVLSADTSLHMPDFRAAERTYQLLAQVSGRAGRAELPGEVFVQTYSPDHFAVRAAASDAGFEGFAAQELAEREEGGYPPFARLVCLTFKGESEEKVRFSAETYARDLALTAGGAAMRVSEACPAPLAKAKKLFRYQILLRAPSVRAMTGPLRALLAKKPLPPGVALAIDVDALSIL
ncbi:MAG TPA: primosomal protein N' [Kiritimatiellia bacterium]|nr:primosomal protein N' [Kiritimatiellia bacterium]HPS08784.1 primosomal protein N' [Kiritimatiellia bacterium]